MVEGNAIIGFFPANSKGDDIYIFENDNREKIIETFSMLRQQTSKPKDKYNLCLADFIAPIKSNIKDYMGFFAVTTGLNIEKQLVEFEQQHDDYSSIMLKALADRLAESFAEHLHLQVRKIFWSYAQDESLNNEDLIAEKYAGIRPAPGYPACPDHTEKITLFRLLEVTKHTNIFLTENLAMLPASSVSGFYFSHPASYYFGIGKIGKDQLKDYALRKQIDISLLLRSLSMHLND